MQENAKKHDSGSGDAIKKAIEYGIDIEMLKANLSRTVAERIARHQSALDLVNLLQKARKI
jgi:hypothetical protein